MREMSSNTGVGMPLSIQKEILNTHPEAITEIALTNLEMKATKTRNKGLQLLFGLYRDFSAGKYQYARDKINALLETFQVSVGSYSISDSQFLKDYGITFFHREGRYYLRPAEVWQPDDWSTVYANVLRFYKGKRVLSAGCGSGWVEIEGIKSYQPTQVTTMDIIPEAVLTTRVNAFWHNAQDWIKVYCSDGFNVLNGSKCFPSFDVSHFCAPQVFRPEDLAKLQAHEKNFTDLRAEETGDYVKPDEDDIYGFSLNKRLIQQSRDMGIKHIFANMALRLPEPVLQAACFGSVQTVGQLVAVKKVEMHPGTSLEHLSWLEKEHSTPTVFYTSTNHGKQITAGQATTRLSQSPPLPVYHDVGLYILTDDPLTSLMAYIEVHDITDVPYDDIAGASLVREGISGVFAGIYSPEDITICPDSKQTWRNIEAIYERSLRLVSIDKFLYKVSSGLLSSEVIKISLSKQSDICKLPLLFSLAWDHGVTMFMQIDIPLHSANDYKTLYEGLRNLTSSQPMPKNIHVVWTVDLKGDEEKTILLTKNSKFKTTFDATAEMTWSRVSMLAQFHLLHRLTNFQMIPSFERLYSNVLRDPPKTDFQVHKLFESGVLEASRQDRKPCVQLDYGANRVDEKASIAKKWGIPCLQEHIKDHGIVVNHKLQAIFKAMFTSRFKLSDGMVLTANGVSDVFNGVALYAKQVNKSIAFPKPGYGEFLENAQTLLNLKTQILPSDINGKLVPTAVQNYLKKFPDGIVYWNMPYPNPTGSEYSHQEIREILSTLNKFSRSTVFIDAVFLDTGELLHEDFDLSLIQIPYVITTGLSKSIGGPGFRVAGAIVSDQDMALSLKENLSVPSSLDITVAYLYYDAIQNCDPKLMKYMKEQCSLMKEKRHFIIKQFSRIGLTPIGSPKGGLFVAFSCNSLYGKIFSHPNTKDTFVLDHKTLGMAFEGCGLRINTPDWTGHNSIVRVVVSEPYSVLEQIPSCINLFKKCCYDQYET